MNKRRRKKMGNSAPSALFAKNHTYVFDDPGRRHPTTRVLLQDVASKTQTVNSALLVKGDGGLVVNGGVGIGGNLYIGGLISGPMLRRVKVTLEPAAVKSLVTVGTVIVPKTPGFTPLMYNAVAKYNYKTTPYTITAAGVTIILSYGVVGGPSRTAANGFIWDGFLDQTQNMTMTFQILNVNTPAADSANSDLILTTNAGQMSPTEMERWISTSPMPSCRLGYKKQIKKKCCEVLLQRAPQSPTRKQSTCIRRWWKLQLRH
jgi:hypothetical protein